MSLSDTGDSSFQPQPWVAKCVCGKRFVQPNSYALHVGCCKRFKQRLGHRLNNAKQKRRVEIAPSNLASPQIAGDVPVSAPEGHSERSRGKKRKPAWIDDDNLDVDLVLHDASSLIANATPGPSTHPTSTQLANQDEDEEGEGHANAQDVGRGHRKKELSYKVKRNTNFLPSSTLPASLYPPDELLHLPPPPPRRRADEGTDDAIAEDSAPHLPALKLRTPINTFGLYKVFRLDGSADRPHDPDDSVLPEDLREDEPLPVDHIQAQSQGKVAQLQRSKYHPFPNISSYLLGEWYWSYNGEKSQRSFRDLLDIVGSEDFQPREIREANWNAIDRMLATSAYDVDDLDSKDWVDDGISWRTTSVTITVPFSKKTDSPGNHSFTVPGFHYRPLVPIIREKLESSSGSEYFHTLGHELHWNPGHGKEHVRVYGELYTSPAFLDAYEALQKSPPEPNCHLPRHIVGLMFGSDSTMLATFGTAKLWPLYMMYGNDSKYRRSKPTENLFETVAYFEKLPDDFKDFLIKRSGKPTTNQALLTHCQREFFHEQWRHLLDDEFIEAYCHGIVVKCYDGKDRRFYPRILTYSADYPEKILLASIKNLGLFPCPRCCIAMADVPAMGKKRDRTNRTRIARFDNEDKRARVSKARALIYTEHSPVTSTLLEGHLAYGSLVPTNNAFTERLSSHGFNLYDMLVVDIMHEVEIGTWKAVFIQLLRILEVWDKGTINKLDERYRSMPTFGKDTIRRFTNNVSEMKQLAARDWEDLLQCSLAAFEGLLPAPHDRRVMKLLFVFCQWHGLAKLRLHTDHTLELLDSLTTVLGEEMRQFVDKTCSKFETKELSREYQARMRREAKKKSATSKGKQPSNSKQPLQEEQPGSVSSRVDGGHPAKRQKTGEGGHSPPHAEPDAASGATGRKEKTLNLNTYKFHSLGDVVSTIRRFGTTDSYSTQMPELFHRYPKNHYKRTSKKNVSRQLSRIQMRQARIRKLRKQLLPEPDEGYQDEHAHILPYFIGKSQNRPVNLPVFHATHRDDPAAKDFFLRLKRHLLPRIYQCLLDEAQAERAEDSDNERIQLLRSLVSSASDDSNFVDSGEGCTDVDQIYLHSDRIYEHNILNINYTSYDVRRETDIVNPKTSRRDVMCLREVADASDGTCTEGGDPHRFIHARVLGIFHTNVIYRGRGSSDLRRRRFDFLFVRWFKFQNDSLAHQNLDRVVLPPASDLHATGFLNPANIVRASHIIPRYALGLKKPDAQGSDRRYPKKTDCDPIVSKLAKDWEDWKEYYVNRFVDRDMIMRYMWGHGVGHAYCHTDAPSAVVVPSNDDSNADGPGQSSNVETSATHLTAGHQYDDTLEDLEGIELDVQGDSERERSEGEDTDLQDPDDEDDDSRW